MSICHYDIPNHIVKPGEACSVCGSASDCSMMKAPMSNETDIVIDLEQQAKNRTSQLSDTDAWKHSVEHRAIQEIIKLRAERDAAVLAERERCKKSVRNTICKMSWPPEDGDKLIDDLQMGIALFATEGGSHE